MDIFSRTKFLIGEDNVNVLNKKRVMIFGIGGVGSYAVEALVRGGIGEITIIDKDVIDETNINRQLIATTKTIGKPKVEVMKERALEINPNVKISTFQLFYNKENKDKIPFECDYIIDAIDTVSSKILIIEESVKRNIPVISSMGTGNKLDPTKFQIEYIEKTNVCPLAKVMRKELKERGIKNIKVLYSKEEPKKIVKTAEKTNYKTDNIISEANISKKYQKPTPASISFVPSVAGLIIAGEVIKDLIGIN